jgi:hypothetical protein
MYRGGTDSNIKIVTSGLLEHWDAAQLRSYSGSGTTWNDLSGRGKNCTLYNGVAFNRTSGGSFLYDNVDDYISAGASGADGNLYSSSGITLAVWFNKPFFNGSRILMYNGRPANTQTDGWNFFIGSGGGTTNLYVEIVGSNNISNTYTSSNGAYSLDTNQYAVVSYNRTNVVMYVNGVQVLSSALTQPIRVAAFADSVVNIGRGSTADSNAFNGTIYSASIYNRGLTATEVLQNFNATRTRFRV